MSFADTLAAEIRDEFKAQIITIFDLQPGEYDDVYLAMGATAFGKSVAYKIALHMGVLDATPFALFSSNGVGTNKTVWKVIDSPDGLWLEAEGAISFSGSGTDGSPFRFALPTGLELDGSRMAGKVDGSSDAVGALCGTQNWYDSGVGLKQGLLQAYDATHVKFIYTVVLTADFFAVGDGLTYNFKAPVKVV